MAFTFLPAGEEYMWYFLWIMVPLHVSYLVSVSVISPDTIWYLPFSIGWVIFVIIVYMIVCFLRWKWSKKKIPEPRSELVLTGLTTLNQAKEVWGCEICVFGNNKTLNRIDCGRLFNVTYE